MINAKSKAVVLIFAAMSMTGCLEWWPEFDIQAGEQPFLELNPAQYIWYSMHNSPAQTDQHEGQTYPPPNTLPEGYSRYPFAASEALKSATIENPIAPTADNLRYGKQMYDTTCIVCHGAEGTGKGYVVPPYPQPPDLTAQRVRNWSDGEIYHVIAHGQGRMWSYKSQLSQMERWAVVNYVRALQRAQYPEPQDLERTSE
jgi:mono/diheme cytochrome c family protein